ncbi:hypothetical protein CJ030_MR7G010700 [Morella rubra]|uniref:Uncharacterized protein n=1 Tax=Morella rubra TaxID=262757 RepID=A0A6A1UYA8_9ROSI|nr:hypothetical protein CJ030_MR7G010707 [Morella rubra]KAB1205359.1 hypothetical protein CJ030_MR7G010700 [Morella rubra]
MRGIGGPLLCIGDLLSDLGESDGATPPDHQEAPISASPSSVSNPTDTPQALELTKLFQKDYARLREALSGTDHSWTALTLKLCSALETANKFIQSTNLNAGQLSEKVGELEKIVKRGDSAVASAKAIHVSLNQKQGPLTSGQNVQ